MRIQKASRPSTEPVDEPRAIDPAGKLEGREAKSISAEGQVATYRPCPVKRDRRTKAEVAEIRAMITDVISGDPPMTVRQVFYQLVARGVIEKSEEQYHRTVIRLIRDAA